MSIKLMNLLLPVEHTDFTEAGEIIIIPMSTGICTSIPIFISSSILILNVFNFKGIYSFLKYTEKNPTFLTSNSLVRL